jgi:hypothetical protein
MQRKNPQHPSLLLQQLFADCVLANPHWPMGHVHAAARALTFMTASLIRPE